MTTLARRMEKAERELQASKGPLKVRRFIVHSGDVTTTPEDFLRSQGHDIDAPGFLNVVRVIVPSPREPPARVEQTEEPLSVRHAGAR